MSLQTRVAAWVHDACGILTAPSECQSALDTNSCKIEAARMLHAAVEMSQRRSSPPGGVRRVSGSWSLGVVSASAGQIGVARRPHTEPDGDVP
jgi:hypothetical protein